MSDPSNLWYFENVDLYKVLCPHLVAADDRHNDKKIYAKNEFVYFPNEKSTTIYLIASGRVKIGGYTSDGNALVKSILANRRLSNGSHKLRKGENDLL